jgi:hypothetical protein
MSRAHQAILRVRPLGDPPRAARPDTWHGACSTARLALPRRRHEGQNGARAATSSGHVLGGGVGDASAAPAQIIWLPSGGGAIRGLGETFSPDLQTGTGKLTIPISVPSGRSGMQSRLDLVYSTGRGNGPFGLGWDLAVPGVSRKTARGVPTYRDADTFILSGTRGPGPGGAAAGRCDPLPAANRGPVRADRASWPRRPRRRVPASGLRLLGGHRERRRDRQARRRPPPASRSAPGSPRYPR